MKEEPLIAQIGDVKIEPFAGRLFICLKAPGATPIVLNRQDANTVADVIKSWLRWTE